MGIPREIIVSFSVHPMEFIDFTTPNDEMEK
jgi:hypothetical protein